MAKRKMPVNDWPENRLLIRETLDRFEREIAGLKKQLGETNVATAAQFSRQTIELSEKLADVCETLIAKIDAKNEKIEKIQNEVNRLKTLAALCGAVGGYLVAVAKDYIMRK